MAHEARIFRRRHGDLAADFASLSPASGDEGLAFVGEITDGGSIPTAVPAWFLALPASFGNAEAEGSAWTATADATRPVPVLVLGPNVPVAGDRVLARMVGGKWVAGSGQSALNLMLAWTNFLVGSGTAPLVATGPDSWSTGCLDIPWTLGFYYLRATLTRTAPDDWRLVVSGFAPGECPAGASGSWCDSDSADPQRLIQIAYVASPLFIRWSVTSSACPALRLQGYNNFTVTG